MREVSVECSPEIDDPVPDSTREEESVSNKVKMADSSVMASEVLVGGRQGQTHACTYVRTHTHTCIRGARGGQGGSFAPL